uniref:FLYWCH-type domain-containing protein n=1 Tax=Branchiostoma floridae TaxID=7739 RepID=C3YB67_BRAFL|eukprot:XP_002606519.1 hypothetical protein BRAFLDRAFT_91897 [Branchiostoma floridae]
MCTAIGYAGTTAGSTGTTAGSAGTTAGSTGTTAGSAGTTAGSAGTTVSATGCTASTAGPSSSLNWRCSIQRRPNNRLLQSYSKLRWPNSRLCRPNSRLCGFYRDKWQDQTNRSIFSVIRHCAIKKHFTDRTRNFIASKESRKRRKAGGRPVCIKRTRGSCWLPAQKCVVQRAQLADFYGYSYTVKETTRPYAIYCSRKKTGDKCPTTVIERAGVYRKGNDRRDHPPEMNAATNLRIKVKKPTMLDFDLKEQHLPDGFFKADIRFDGHRHLVFTTDQQLKLLSTAKTWDGIKAKIIDFSSACLLDRPVSFAIPGDMSTHVTPHVARGGKVTCYSDVFSYEKLAGDVKKAMKTGRLLMLLKLLQIC